jgi:AraC-like DNA-binding protein
MKPKEMGAPRMFCSECQPKAERLNPVRIHAELTIPSLASLVRRCASLLYFGGDEVFSGQSMKAIQGIISPIRIEELARGMGHESKRLGKEIPPERGALPRAVWVHLGINERHSSSKPEGHDFSSIAHSAGYSDQSHFINDFKRVTGLAPSAFFRQSAMCESAEFLQVAFASN